MNHFPTISIIIPSWNQGKFIKRTLLSILKQEYPSAIQVIVSDGGSTDETVSVLEEFGSNITWWSARDKGFVDAVMKGAQKATGEILAIQSSDDYYLPGTFMEMAKTFCENPTAGFVSGGELSIDLAGNLISSSLPTGPINPQTILYKTIPAQHASFIKRELFEQVGGLRLEVDMCADIDLWYRSSHLQPGVYFNKYVGVYQLHPNQRTAVSDKWFSSLVKMVEITEQVPEYGSVFRLDEKEKKDLYSYWEMTWTAKRDANEGKKVAIRKVPHIFSQSFRTNRMLAGIITPETVKKTMKYFKKGNAEITDQSLLAKELKLDWYKD